MWYDHVIAGTIGGFLGGAIFCAFIGFVYVVLVKAGDN